MSTTTVWRYAAFAPEALAEFRRSAVCAIDLAGPAERALAAHFERELRIGDVLVTPAQDGTLAVGEVLGDAHSRPGIHHMQVLRSMRWRQLRDETLLRMLAQAPATPQALDAAAAARLRAALGAAAADGHAADGDDAVSGDTPVDAVAHDASASDDAARLAHLRIERVDRVVLPELGTLYQSPEAERILRDFRWREYLHANPDVAADCLDEAAASRHFFYQGFYERRIFDPQRLHGFDPSYYRARYPELGLADDAQAQIHYCYRGWYEERVPNADTGWLHDADLHIFQMGKVGSHSVGRALQEAGYGGRVVQGHWAADIVRNYPSCGLPYARILGHARAQPVRVVSGVREIVSWALSCLFQYLGADMINAADAIRLVEERFWEQAQNGLRWFDHGYFCGLDVYAQPFDHAAGHIRMRHGPIDLFVYRQEDLSRMERPLAAFMGLPALTLHSHNDGAHKVYAGHYALLRSGLRLPGNLLAELYDSAYMRHFYSDSERQRGWELWVQGQLDGV